MKKIYCAYPSSSGALFRNSRSVDAYFQKMIKNLRSYLKLYVKNIEFDFADKTSGNILIDVTFFNGDNAIFEFNLSEFKGNAFDENIISNEIISYMNDMDMLKDLFA